jgi:capsule polysaccharide export protein KpsE/RkpR
MEDEEPELAAAIAKTARNRINTLGQSLVKNGQNRTIATFVDNITAKERQIKVLSDTLQSLRQRYGIFNTEAQSESLTGQASSTESRLINFQAKLKAFSESNFRGYRDSVAVYEVKVAGLQEEMNQLNNKLSSFNEGLSKVEMFTNQYEMANTTLGYDKEKLKQYQATASADIPALILVEEATVPRVKSRPFRTLIVLASVLVTFIFTVIGILLFEANRDIDWQSIYEGK